MLAAPSGAQGLGARLVASNARFPAAAGGGVGATHRPRGARGGRWRGTGARSTGPHSSAGNVVWIVAPVKSRVEQRAFPTVLNRPVGPAAVGAVAERGACRIKHVGSHAGANSVAQTVCVSAPVDAERVVLGKLVKSGLLDVHAVEAAVVACFFYGWSRALKYVVKQVTQAHSSSDEGNAKCHGVL